MWTFGRDLRYFHRVVPGLALAQVGARTTRRPPLTRTRPSVKK